MASDAVSSQATGGLEKEMAGMVEEVEKWVHSRVALAERKEKDHAALVEKAQGVKWQLLVEKEESVAHRFEQALGMRFEKQGDETLRVSFTNVDPREPGRCFYLSIKVDEADVYEVKECEPMVSGMEDLLVELNSTNDFAAFIVGVRKKFRRTVA